MALVPHKITALAESDAQGTNGKNIVAGAVVSLYDTTGTAVTLFDDAAGTNGSTAKTTDATGQVVVWVTPGEYDEEVNGSTQRRVTVGGNSPIELPTFASLEELRPTKTGQAFICQERANAKYILQASGYTALAGDVTFANGRVGALQIRDCNDLSCYGVGYGVKSDQSTIVQSAIDRVRTELGSGVLSVSGEVWLGSTVWLWERVWLMGANGMIVNWYQSDGTYNAKGAGFRGLAGTNADLIKLGISGNETAGASIPAESNVARRHGGGLANLYIDGYRSEDNTLSSVDLNSAGRPLVCRGVNLVVIHDVVVSRGAENNVVFESNGDADGQCNNMYIHRVYSQGSAQSGFNLSGGDSNIGFLWGSQNAINGMTSSMSNTTFSSMTFNDNSENGLFSSGEDCDFVGVKTYDNRKNGKLIAGKNNSVTGGMSRHNGMNSSFVSTDRCGLVATSAADNCVIVGHKSFDDGYRGDALDITQQYGYRVLNASTTVIFEANNAHGNIVNDYSFQSAPKKSVFDGVLDEVSKITYSSPVTLSSISSNELPATKGLVTLNVGGGVTINTIINLSGNNANVIVRNINTSPATFTNSSSIRIKGGGNLTLNQNEAATFQEFAPGVWFEV